MTSAHHYLLKLINTTPPVHRLVFFVVVLIRYQAIPYISVVPRS